MGDRVIWKKVWPLIGASALIVGMIPPRLVNAQTPTSPPPLQQLIHSFDIDQPEATAYAIWNSGQPERHEVWFRIVGGEADYQQRLQVYKEQAAPRSPEMLPPASTLVYDIENNDGSDWIFLGTENAFFTYYFDGDHRLNSDVNWDNAEAVRVRKTVYRNGDLYEISFEDIDQLDDYDDLEIEVILIRR
jgi:hypothetical protein